MCGSVSARIYIGKRLHLRVNFRTHILLTYLFLCVPVSTNTKRKNNFVVCLY